MQENEIEDVQVINVNLYMTSESHVLLRRTRGFLPRLTFASWEKSFAEYFGVVPNKRMAFEVTIMRVGSGALHSVVLVFSGDVVRLGYEVLNGTLVKRAPGV